MTGAIVIFVKTPGISPVKTRLAAKLGQEMAEAFHLAASKAVTESVQMASVTKERQGYFAVAEQEALNHDYWQDLPCLWQGEATGLGERMAHIYQTLLEQHDYVILVGADIPQMTAKQLLDAASWLTHAEQARFAFGPSDDGGFWLLGGNCHIPAAVWTDVIYSHKNTGADFLQQIKLLGEVRKLPSLCDVDEFNDLLTLYQTLQHLSSPLLAQQQLMGVLDTIFVDINDV